MIGALSSPSEDTRSIASNVLYRWRCNGWDASEAVLHLDRLLMHSDPAIRQSAKFALQDLTANLPPDKHTR